MQYPIHDFGGSGLLNEVTGGIALAVANGITPETYLPMLRPLLADYHAVCMLPRALWNGQPVPEQLGEWKTDYARDLLDGLRHHGLTDMIAIGHSYGGVSWMLAVLEEPVRFRALVLLDPTIFAPELLAMFKALREAGTIGDDFPMAARALKRQRHFENADAAYTYFRPRGMFKDWDDEAVRQYVEHGLVPDGHGLALRWSPEWEAYTFQTAHLETWEDLPKLNGLLPTLIVRGEASDTYVTESALKVSEILPSATHIDIPGHGHLFPQSAPAETARIVREWLSSAL